MKSVLCCVLLACFVAFIYAARKQQFRCDYTYFKETDGYLKYHEVPADWHEAQLRCHMEGSVLASPINKPIRSAMMNFANRSNVCGVFTGIHSRFSRGDMFSVEGVPLSMIPHTWAANEPDNDKDEEGCIAMLKDGAFADFSCTDTLPYMCYKKATPGMMMNACGTTDDAYTLDKRTNSCYKFHRYPRTWSRAYMTCAAEGGYLAIINSETEAQLIRELWAKNPNIVGVGDYVRDVASVGFHDWNEHGEWRTIHGQTLTEAGYDKFAPGEPNNFTIQYCGGVYRTGLFDDIWCDRRTAFICEKNPDMLTCPDDE
ncbi:hypothetical protein O0L34_g14113 [Tuta absoluta]|nr:hypothetical protein O0L34_g14113 [Tuta absoluta]